MEMLESEILKVTKEAELVPMLVRACKGMESNLKKYKFQNEYLKHVFGQYEKMRKK